MNDTVRTAIHPEVEDFVTDVRARLADLSDDEREELLGGLEADLSEKLADGAALGDPASYAEELRSAAGLPMRARSRRLRRPVLPSVSSLESRLDRAREQWDEMVEARPWGRQAWEVAESVRPAWWVLRAWIAVTLLDQLAGEWEYVTLLPTLALPLLGPTVLLVAVVLSVLIGLGRLWPGSGPRRTMLARLVLVALNVLAVLAPLSFAVLTPQGSDLRWSGYGAGFRDGAQQPGLSQDGDEIRNLFVYNANGRLVQGAQVFRGNGDPLLVRPQDAHTGRGKERLVGCGWFNGPTELFNVFPLAQRPQLRGSCLDEPGRRDQGGPTVDAEPPFAQVPPVTSPVPSPVTPSAPVAPVIPAEPTAPAGR